MELVIDISEKLYNKMKTYQGLDDTYVAVKKGTPLPKGHGRLIDADALNFADIDNANYGSNYIRIASTIIEADKAEGSDKE